MKCAWKVTWKWIEPPGRSWKRSKLVQPPWYQDNWIKYIWSNTIPIQMDCPGPWYHVGFPALASRLVQQYDQAIKITWTEVFSPTFWAALNFNVSSVENSGEDVVYWTTVVFNHQMTNDKFMMNTILNENIVSLILDKPAKHPPSFHLRLAS